jgi:hypothetical protein
MWSESTRQHSSPADSCIEDVLISSQLVHDRRNFFYSHSGHFQSMHGEEIEKEV